MKKLFILLVCLLPVLAQAQMETSVAGFIPLSGSGRIVYNFNPGWRFHRGDIKGAEAVRFDDTSWQVVSAPHTVELMPAEASGCRNYQGVAWYRKHFVIPQDMKGKEVSLHFEGAMGKSFSSYLEKLRLEKAKKLIAEGKWDMETIAQMVGYGSSATFRRAFKRAYGIAPSAWKE